MMDSWHGDNRPSETRFGRAFDRVSTGRVASTVMGVAGWGLAVAQVWGLVRALIG